MSHSPPKDTPGWSSNVCRHQGKKVGTGQLTAGPLDKTTLLGQGLQTLWRKHKGEFLFDFLGKRFRFLVSRHEALLSSRWALRKAHRTGEPHDEQNLTANGC